MKNIITSFKNKIDIESVFFLIIIAIIFGIIFTGIPINLFSKIGVKDFLTVIVPLIVLSATLSLLSFTYLLVMHNIWNEKINITDNTHLDHLSYSDFKKKIDDIRHKLDGLHEKNDALKSISDNNTFEKKEVEVENEIKKFESELKKLENWFINYKYKLILRSGEYYLVSTLYLVMVFGLILFLYIIRLFFTIPAGLNEILFNIAITITIISVIFFSKGIMSTSMFLGHLKLLYKKI